MPEVRAKNPKNPDAAAEQALVTEILVGRDPEDLEKYGSRGCGIIGRHFVGERREAHLTNPIKMDLARPHVIGVFGKRGTGKSYTLGILAEEIMLLPDEIRANLSCLIIDTMGIFWSLKNPNEKDFSLLREWGMKPRGFDVLVLIPEGQQQDFREKEVPFDGTISIRPEELSIEDWLLTFNIDADSEMGVLLARMVKQLKEKEVSFSLAEAAAAVREEEAEPRIKESLINRFLLAEDWGIFSAKGSKVLEIIKPGRTTVIDVSLIPSWEVRALLVGLLARRVLDERIKARRMEEVEAMAGRAKSYMPITWMLVDEGHQFLPAEGKTAATGPLLQWVKIGREPGVSLVMATQQPFKLHGDALSQCDLLISHRLTSKVDIDALSAIMQTYLKYNLGEYIDALPRVKGAAIVLDDNSERLFAMRARPRMSWHAGGSPIAIKE